MTKHKLTLIEHFTDIQDPRLKRKQLHKFDDIFFALCAVICGCDDWVAIEKFANIKRTWFKQYLSLENGIPSHDTLGRVFSLIAPEQFQTCFSCWIKRETQNSKVHNWLTTRHFIFFMMSQHALKIQNKTRQAGTMTLYIHLCWLNRHSRHTENYDRLTPGYLFLYFSC